MNKGTFTVALCAGLLFLGLLAGGCGSGGGGTGGPAPSNGGTTGSVTGIPVETPLRDPVIMLEGTGDSREKPLASVTVESGKTTHL